MESQILNKNPKNFRATVIIRIKGSKPEVQTAESAIKSIPGIQTMTEGEARFAIQKMIDEHHLLARIMFDGNSVWSKKRIIDNLDKIIQAGVLWDKREHEFRDNDNSGKPIKVKHTQNEAPKMIQIGNCLILPNEGFRCLLSPYFYEFLSCHCGSIAHFDIHGWVTAYPTLDHLKKFFNRNEYGYRVLDMVSQQPRNTDVIEVVKAIEARLYPFKTYMASKQASKAQAEVPLQTIKKP